MFKASEVIRRVRSTFENLPDHRKGGNNQRYRIADAALSALAVFFTQSPSFLDHQVRMQKGMGKSNVQSLFGVHKIPSSNQIRNLLDSVDPKVLDSLMMDLTEQLLKSGRLDHWRSINKSWLIALDGTDSFSSEKISCTHCVRRKQTDGKFRYRHPLVSAAVVSPGQTQVLVLPPEFVATTDQGHKQDCESLCAGRWLDRLGSRVATWNVTLLGDDLYSRQPFCQKVLGLSLSFIFSCKESSHRFLSEWVSGLIRMGKVDALTHTRKRGKERFVDTYRYVNQAPLRSGEDGLKVNWCELVTTTPEGKVIYRNTWVTSHPIDRENVQAIAEAGRTRWKIENEGHNVLKTKGYHFEHNFGHGKKHLANLLSTLTFLAFLLHTLLDLLETIWQEIRSSLSSRRSFFEYVRITLHLIVFDSWEQFFAFLLNPEETLQPPAFAHCRATPNPPAFAREISN